MYLIKYEKIMMFIGYISHVLKINIINRGISCHTSNTTIFENSIYSSVSYSYIELNQINFNYNLSKKEIANSNKIEM